MYPAGVPGVEARFLATACGVRVRIAESGVASPRVMLLLHGWGCSLYSFRFLIEPLARAGYHVIALDFQGHGLSDKPGGASNYTLNAMTDHLIECIEALGAEQVELLGHSMGGRIAVETMLRRPALVSRLWLINPVGFGPMPHITMARPFARAALASMLPSPLPASIVRLPVSAVYGRVGGPTSRDIEEYRAPSQFRTFLQASAHLLRAFDWTVMPAPKSDSALLSRSRILLGELDRVVQVVRSGGQDRLAREGWTANIVKDVAHVIHEETPDEVLRMILGGSK